MLLRDERRGRWVRHAAPRAVVAVCAVGLALAAVSAWRLEDAASADAAGSAVAGMIVHADPDPPRLWVWDPGRVLVELPGTDRLGVVTAPDGGALTGVRTLVSAARTVWVLHPAHVYRHVSGTRTTAEVLAPDGAPIGGGRGLIGAARCPQAFGGDAAAGWVLVWTADRLMVWDGSGPRAAELRAGASAVAGVQGVVPACGDTAAWLWTPTAVYRWTVGSRQVVEIKTAGGSAIAATRTIGVDTRDTAWIVAAGGVFRQPPAGRAAWEVRDVAGSSVSGGRLFAGQVAALAGAGPLVDPLGTRTDGVWLADAAHLYRLFPERREAENLFGPAGGAPAAALAAADLRAPAGEPLAGVRGFVAAGASPGAADEGGLLAWNADELVDARTGSDRGRAITSPGGAPIAGLRGVVALPAADANRVFFWTDTAFYRLLEGASVAEPVPAADGSALTGLRGAAVAAHSAASPVPFGAPAGISDVWVWSAGGAFVLRAGQARATVVRRPDGGAIAGTWAILADGERAWLRTAGAVYAAARSSAVARELRTAAGTGVDTPGVGRLAVVVHPMGRVRSQGSSAEAGPWGASLVDPPLPLPVALAGPLRGGVDTLATGSPAGLTTLTAFGGALAFVQGTGTASLAVPPAALLVLAARGDCNGDGQCDAADISALVLEIFDGDGILPANTPGGTFPGNAVGCDPNGDGKVDAGDIACTGLLLFGQACAGP